MEIHKHTDGGVTFVALEGHFEAFSLPAVSEELGRLIDDGARKLCLNLKGVSFINSTALGYLVATSKKLKELDGELVLSEPSGFLAATIRTLELHLLFEIFPTDAKAKEHFG
ncbi:MAG: STAS domain-containing protein [Deltaproteobacteria bacterium]|nr:STAS domain-containing protein [Deltaproteobacteria bacterium]